MYDWDDANVAHLARHAVSRDEVEQVFNDPNQFEYSSRIIDGEERFAVVGATLTQRILKVVFTIRGEWVRVVTAYDASPVASRRYMKRRV